MYKAIARRKICGLKRSGDQAKAVAARRRRSAFSAWVI